MKRLLLFFMIAVFVVMNVGEVLADTPEGKNWGDVWGDGITDALGVRDITSYFVKPQGYGPGSSIPLEYGIGDIYWSTSFPVDAVVIRTTQTSGSFGGDYTPLSAIFEWNRETEEMEIGTFDVDIDSGSLTYSWDFTGVDDRILVGHLSALSDDVEVASLDHVVVKVEEDPTFDVFVGVQGIHESLRSYGPISSTDMVVDLGLIVMDPDDGSHPKMDVIFANFWNRQVEITNTELVYAYQIFAPDLYENDLPGFVSVTSPDIVDPALAAHFHLPENTVTGSSFDITFAESDPLTLTWLWAYSFLGDDPNNLGMIWGVTSENLSDINDDIDPDVAYVVNMAEDQLEYPYGVFSIITSADAGNYIAQIDIMAGVPTLKRDGLSVYPLGIRLAVDVDQVAVYSEELDSAISEEFGEELPTEGQIIEAVRKHVAFTKEWSDGTTVEIQLDDTDFEDAVDIWVEFDEEGEAESIFFTVNLLIVNGGEPGMVDSAIVNGRQYIVIYDGNLDDKFADPLKLTAATPEPETTSGDGGNGCSALGFAPGIGLLLLPLFMLRRK